MLLLHLLIVLAPTQCPLDAAYVAKMGTTGALDVTTAVDSLDQVAGSEAALPAVYIKRTQRCLQPDVLWACLKLALVVRRTSAGGTYLLAAVMTPHAALAASRGFIQLHQLQASWIRTVPPFCGW